jgi:hypothetical protein
LARFEEVQTSNSSGQEHHFDKPIPRKLHSVQLKTFDFEIVGYDDRGRKGE